MPIVDKINALTGKSAETIEDAIANMSGGSGGGGDCNVEVIRCAGVLDESGYSPVINIPVYIDMTLEEICEKLESGKIVFFDARVQASDADTNYFIPINQMDKWSEDGVNGFSIAGRMVSGDGVAAFEWESGEEPVISLMSQSAPGGRV